MVLAAKYSGAYMIKYQMHIPDEEMLKNKIKFLGGSLDDILEKYWRYADPLSKKCISNYQLLRHLYGLYYKTSSAKKWNKHLHGIIQDEKDIMMVSDFRELAYEEKISSYS
mgnify:CR=1 FL=1